MAALSQWELGILDWMGKTLHSGLLDKLMPRISFLGDNGWFWIVLVLLLLVRRPSRKAGLTVAIALLFSLLAANILLKPIVARVRPFEVNTAVQLLIDAPGDFSFPSGHAQAAFAAATALFLFHKKAGAAALVLAALIAFSRLYLYVHYLSDVLAGMIIGILLGRLAFRLVKGLPGQYRSQRRRKRGRSNQARAF